MNHNTTSAKRIAAKGTASYRGVEIKETEEGVAVILGGKKHELKSLKAATAWIDQLYADAAYRVTMGATRQ